MSEIDPFVKALTALCAREGGYASVADKAKVNADGLWQILNGTKLPSGNPRGVGPGTRKKLTAAYPDWLATGEGPKNPQTIPAVYQPNQPIPLAGRAGGAMDLGAVIDELAAAMLRTDPVDRAAAKAYLMGLCDAPDRLDLRDKIRATLEPPAAQKPIPETGAKRAA